MQQLNKAGNSAPIAKNIIFCADGTWNGPGEVDSDDKTSPPTNVFKLFLNLAGQDTPDTYLLEKEQERVLTAPDGTIQQWAKYLHGVGDSDNPLVKLLGGSMGAGLIARIVRGYTFLSRNYVAGDKIFIVGFSRGAYTARALGGMISSQGLLKAEQCVDRDRAYKLGTAAWYQYRRSAMKGDTTLLQRLDDELINIPGIFAISPASNMLTPAPIAGIAVWDTVGALGIPEYAKGMIRVDVFRFADLILNSNVKSGLHAVAIDEIREDFTPTLWVSDPRIVQALFAGAHGDVGGGYPNIGHDSELSDCALNWMTQQLDHLGVLFSEVPQVVVRPNPCGPAHKPDLAPPWDVLPKGSRVFPGATPLSQFVRERMAGGPVESEPGRPPAPYDPINLPHS